MEGEERERDKKMVLVCFPLRKFSLLFMIQSVTEVSEFSETVIQDPDAERDGPGSGLQVLTG